MCDSIVVKIFLVIYTIIAFFVFGLLWRNSAAPDATKNVSILVASMLPVLIAILPYLRSEKIEKHFHYVLLYDSKEKMIIDGNMFGPYSLNYVDMFMWLPDVNALKADTLDDAMKVKGLDIIEKGVITGLVWKFMSHWDIKSLEYKGPISSREMSKTNPNNITAFIDWQGLEKIFKQNRLFSTPIIGEPKLAIPPDCKVQTPKTDSSHVIYFSNSYITLQISLKPSYGSVIQQEIKGVFSPDTKRILSPDPQDRFSYYAIGYNITATLSIKRTRTYAPEIESYRRWFENICEVLSKYDWNTINEQIEKNSINKAISDISEIKKNLINQSKDPNSATKEK